MHYFAVIACILSSLLPHIALASTTNQNVYFKVTDAYFKGTAYINSWPLHLTHEPIEPYQLRRGEKFKLWIKIVNGKSPCANKSEKLCVFKITIIDSQKIEQLTSEPSENPFSMSHNTTMEWSLQGIISPKTALGESMVRFSYLFNDETIFSHDVPVIIE